LEPIPTYFALLDTYMTGEIRCPLNLPDRRRAGFDTEELDRLAELCGEGGSVKWGVARRSRNRSTP
jgi:uncharacterized ferritin-like protein (DUF455 family)